MKLPFFQFGKRFFFFLGTLPLLLAGYFLFQNNPGSGSGWLSCPFHESTGFLCPGCGTTRAVHHLLHGRFLRSLQCSAMLWVYWLWFILLLVRRTRQFLFRSFVLLLILGAVYMILRNSSLPCAEFLRP